MKESGFVVRGYSESLVQGVKMANFTIRRMKEPEVQIAIDWAQKEGWNPGLNDASCFYKTDPNGFFIGLLGQEPVAVGSAVIYSEDFSFCGLYIVKNEVSWQRLGIKIDRRTLEIHWK